MAGITKYQLDVSTDDEFNSYEVQNLLVENAIYKSVGSLQPGTVYYYQVRSENATGASVSSSPSQGVLTLPAAPTIGTPTSITASSFTANWGSVQSATGYLLYVSKDNFATHVAGYDGASVGSISHNLVGLEPGVSYKFRVRAVNGSGQSALSSSNTATLLSGIPTVSPESSVTTSSFTANWNAVAGATEYRLDVATSEAFGATILSGYSDLPVTGTSKSVTGRQAGTPHHYRVRAVFGSYASGSSLPEATITLTDAPTAAAASSQAASSFTANWSAVTGASGYRLDVATNPGFAPKLATYDNLLVTGTSRSVTGLPQGTIHYYRVRGFNSSGSSVNSSPITAITTPLAAAPTTIASTSFTASWAPVIDVSEYRLDVSLVNDFTTLLGNYNNKLVNAAATTQSVTGLATGTTYYYRIRAVKGSAVSESSTGITVLTKAAAPILSPATDVTPTTFTVSWTPSNSASGYLLYVGLDEDFDTYHPGYAGLSTSNTTVVVSGLDPAKTYYYRVRAVNASGNSAFSAVLSTVTDGLFLGMNANYVVSNNVQVGGVTLENQVINLAAKENSQTVQYFDGLGRPVQTVATQASPSRLDIVTPVVYDQFGREAKTYLPYVPQANNGQLKSVAFDAAGDYTHTFYDGSAAIAADNRPFAETIYEASPLNRPLRNIGPGQAWYTDAGNNKATVHAYLANSNGNTDGQERVICWTLDGAGMPVRSAAVSGYVTSSGYYESNQLSLKSTKDEMGRDTREFTDKLGRVVLKKVQSSGSATPETYDRGDWAQTYYVYDDLGNLRYVIQPTLSYTVHQNGTYLPSQAELDAAAFIYTYDERKRMITKKVPGAGVVYMVYDKRDRLVMTQDANQRAAMQWLYTKYDHLDRPIITGIYTHGSVVDRLTMQNNFSTTAFSESYNGVSGTKGYTNLLFPTTGTQLLTATYYDNYDFKSLISGSTDNYVVGDLAGQAAAFDRVSGLVTGSQTIILGTSTFLWSVAYYDDRYRVIQTIGRNNMGGRDRVTNLYDFAGKVTESVTTHITGSTTTKIKRRFAYDHAGRLLKTWHKVGNEKEVLLASNEYNELGQLTRKALYGPNASNGGAPFRHGDDNLYANDISLSEYAGEKKVVATTSVRLLAGFNFKAGNSQTFNAKVSPSEVNAAEQDAATGYQAVDYRYNIRGWLSRINNSSLSAEEAGDPKDYFGMELAYHEVLSGISNTASWNGNITAAKWSVNLGLAKSGVLIPEFDERAYRYSYDALNRLTGATHRVKTTAWGSSTSLNESGITYDMNGNIKTLKRNDAYNVKIDSLIYGYSGNQLMKVDDHRDDTKGFIDGTNTGDDYAYDANGNLTQDLNKGIEANSILYNHLNLPKQVNKSTGEMIEYVYDAGGRKLQQKVYATNGTSVVKTTDYAGEFVYENTDLQFIMHEEGRYVPSGGYEYFLKDHLGNTRMSFTTVPGFDSYTAGYEDGDASTEALDFGASYALATRSPAQKRNGTKSQLLGGGAANNTVGLAKSMRVMPGDTINTEVYAKYVGSEGGDSNVEVFIFGALTGAFGVTGSTPGEGGMFFEQLQDMDPQDLLASGAGVNEDVPQAYLNYLLFNDDFELYDLGFKQLSANASNAWERLALDIFPRQPGYVYIYISNENDKIIDVYFDDLRIDYHHSPVVQGDDYYPFGLAFNSYKSGVKNDYLYNGKELQDELDLGWLDYGARMYIADIGRWVAIDFLAEKYMSSSPYNYVDNNPIRRIDPNGMEVVETEESWKFTGDDAQQLFSELSQTQQGGSEEGDGTGKKPDTESPLTKISGIGPAISPMERLSANTGMQGELSKRIGIGIADGLGFAEGALAIKGIMTSLRALGYSAAEIQAAVSSVAWRANPFRRGLAIEGFLSSAEYAGFTWTRLIKPNFHAIDFVKDGLGVSVKTTSAEGGFAKILKNIDDLATARQAGSIEGTVIKNVRLDVYVPKGYDQNLLRNVTMKGQMENVPVRILEF